MYPFSTFHSGSSPFGFCHFERFVPSNSTTASAGAAAISLNAAPEATTGGNGRFGSCTFQGRPGSFGVSS